MLEIVLGIVIGPSGVGWAKPDVVLPRGLLYLLEPEPYGQVASTERLRLKVVGWPLRHVRPRDAMTVGPPPVPSGKLPFAAHFQGVYRPVPFRLRFRSTQWRGSGGGRGWR